MNEENSDAQAKLYEALSNAQGEMKHAAKGKVNPFFKSHYADLVAIIDVSKSVLAKHGLAVSQGSRVDRDVEGKPLTILQTRLTHKDGGVLLGEYPVVPVKDDPQGLGSSWTYARRYTLAAMVGVAAEEEDDDANAASRPEAQERPAQRSETMTTRKRADGATVTEGDVFHSCGNKAIASKWPKAGTTHYCGKCKASFEPFDPDAPLTEEPPPF